jgi:hypothetical protein
MLSLERCREILGTECALSDAELELLRDQLAALADIVLEVYPNSLCIDENTSPDILKHANQQQPTGKK